MKLFTCTCKYSFVIYDNERYIYGPIWEDGDTCVAKVINIKKDPEWGYNSDCAYRYEKNMGRIVTGTLFWPAFSKLTE